MYKTGVYEISGQSTADLLRYQREMHRLHGEHVEGATPLSVVGIERELCKELTKRGLVMRYVDGLAKAAGTVPDQAPPPTAHEVALYASLNAIGIEPDAVSLVQKLNSSLPELYLAVGSPALRAVAPSILKAVQRMLPPGVRVMPDTDLGGDDFVEVRSLYALQLVPASQRETAISTARAAIRSFQASASAASKIYKSGKDPSVPFTVMKRALPERIVTGVILEPEVPDASRDPELATDGDIYSEAEIQKAMYWWMENAGQVFSYHHVKHGGKQLTPGDVVILENWQARAMFTEGDQVIRKGAWMLSTRVKNDQLWQDIEEHKINSWSLGISAMGALERIAA